MLATYQNCPFELFQDRTLERRHCCPIAHSNCPWNASKMSALSFRIVLHISVMQRQHIPFDYRYLNTSTSSKQTASRTSTVHWGLFLGCWLGCGGWRELDYALALCSLHIGNRGDASFIQLVPTCVVVSRVVYQFWHVDKRCGKTIKLMPTNFWKCTVKHRLGHRSVQIGRAQYVVVELSCGCKPTSSQNGNLMILIQRDSSGLSQVR